MKMVKGVELDCEDGGERYEDESVACIQVESQVRFSSYSEGVMEGQVQRKRECVCVCVLDGATAR